MSMPEMETPGSSRDELNERLASLASEEGPVTARPPNPLQFAAQKMIQAGALAATIQEGGLDYQEDGRNLFRLVQCLDEAHAALGLDDKRVRDKATMAAVIRTATHYQWRHSRQSNSLVQAVLYQVVYLYRLSIDQGHPEWVGL